MLLPVPALGFSAELLFNNNSNWIAFPQLFRKPVQLVLILLLKQITLLTKRNWKDYRLALFVVNCCPWPFLPAAEHGHQECLELVEGARHGGQLGKTRGSGLGNPRF